MVCHVGTAIVGTGMPPDPEDSSAAGRATEGRPSRPVKLRMNSKLAGGLTETANGRAKPGGGCLRLNPASTRNEEVYCHT